LVLLALRTGLFTVAEADVLLRTTLDAHHAGTLSGRYLLRVSVSGPDDVPAAWTYAAESPVAPSVWDVWWVGVDPAEHRRGVGTELLDALEAELRAADARVVVIETSDGPMLAAARAFYPRCGYHERGRIPDFYGPGEAKIIFSKTLADQAGRAAFERTRSA
jgi:ribosomal protein S18 acetylase RimI-like enzyme